MNFQYCLFKFRALFQLLIAHFNDRKPVAKNSVFRAKNVWNKDLSLRDHFKKTPVADEITSKRRIFSSVASMMSGAKVI